TRSGHTFSPWETIHCTAFNIATAVATAVDLHQEEDLAEPDSGHSESLDELDGGSSHHFPTKLTLPSVTATTATPATNDFPTELASSSAAATTATTATTMTDVKQTSHDKRRSKVKRAAARNKAKLAPTNKLDPASRHPRHLKKPASPIKASSSTTKLRVAKTGWIGIRDNGVSEQEAAAGVREAGWTHKMEDLFGPNPKYLGFKYVKNSLFESRPLVDQDEKVCGMYAGAPSDQNWWTEVHDRAVAAMEWARENCSISEVRTFHRRGNWASLTTGQSHGGGQVMPGTLLNGVINSAILIFLLNESAFIRLAGFATGVFATWAPNLYEYYVDHMKLFYGQYPHLKRPFLNGIWSACTFNLGPKTCARGHRDFANLAFGWCVITALGKFDYTKGGHLILWDCKLIIEFPPGSTILIPSAAIFHSNLTLASPGETRFSFTQYTAGGIFRWVERGFQSEEAYLSSLSKEEQVAEREAGLERGRTGAQLFSTLDELKSMYP
ncbi:hypothetical protein C8J57DRAFT_1058650, partial [Mycena rebaudengoi]